MYASAWVFIKLDDANGPATIVESHETPVEAFLGPPALPSSPPLSTEKKVSQRSSLEKIDESTEIC